MPIGVTGVILGAVYLLSATRRMLFGPLTLEANREVTDIGRREIGLMLPIVVLVVWMGVQPNAFLSRTEGTLDALVERVDRERDRRRVVQLEPAPAPSPAATAASTR